MNRFWIVWLFVAIVALAASTVRSDKVTPSEQCPGESFEGLQDRIQVIPCGKSRCRLPKNTNITVIFKFFASIEVKSLKNEVNANIGGVTLPFPGVDGTDACQQVKRADTGEAVSCPLPAGHEYVYTNVFPVLSLYPAVGMRVHWSLNDGKRSLICFEVPAVIISKK